MWISDRAAATLGAVSLALAATLSPTLAETTPPSPAAAEPNLPLSSTFAPPKPDSPVVETLVGQDRPPLLVRKHPSDAHSAYRRVARHHHVPRDLDRPALAGVQLVEPLPLPGEPPHVVVPMPAYPLDAVAAAFTTPSPPVVCHRTRRDADAPDPHLYREAAVECVPDNP